MSGSKRAGPSPTDPPAERPHPSQLAQGLAVVMRLPRYGRLAASLARDPAVPRRSKAALAAGVVYVAMPVDLVPGVIPIVGQLDDVAALLIGIRVAIRALPADVSARHLASVGLSPDVIDRDLAIIGQTFAWVASSVARTSVRAVIRGSLAALGAVRGTTERLSEGSPVRSLAAGRERPGSS